MADYFQEQLDLANQRIGSEDGRANEGLLGKGLMQPFTNSNSGSRKLMFSVILLY